MRTEYPSVSFVPDANMSDTFLCFLTKMAVRAWCGRVQYNNPMQQWVLLDFMPWAMVTAEELTYISDFIRQLNEEG